MKKALYFIVFGSLLIGGLAGVIYFGDQPKSEPQIPLSFFENQEAVANALVQKFFAEFKKSPVLIVGVWPDRPEELNLVQALLGRLKDQSLGYEVVLVEGALPGTETFPAAARISFRDDLPGVLEGVSRLSRDGKRIALIVPSMYSSRLLAGSPADRWRNEFQAPSMNLTMAPFPLKREDEKTFPVQCQTTDELGVGPLGCAVIHRARWMYKQAKPADRYSLAVDLVGDQDYLMLIAPPAGSAPAAGTGS